MRGVGFNFTVTKTFGRAELYIGRASKAENKFLFDTLYQQQQEVEEAFGGTLGWERLDVKKASRIKAEATGDVFDRDQWPSMISFMTDAMVRLEAALRKPLMTAQQRMKVELPAVDSTS